MVREYLCIHFTESSIFFPFCCQLTLGCGSGSKGAGSEEMYASPYFRLGLHVHMVRLRLLFFCKQWIVWNSVQVFTWYDCSIDTKPHSPLVVINKSKS